MFINTLFGLLVPWIAALFLLKKDLRIFLLTAPFAAVVAFTFDVLGIYFQFWRIDPKNEIEMFAALPMYLGIYPILTAYLFYFIKRTGRNPAFWILIFSLLTTVIEFIGVMIGITPLL